MLVLHNLTKSLSRGILAQGASYLIDQLFDLTSIGFVWCESCNDGSQNSCEFHFDTECTVDNRQEFWMAHLA